MHFWKSRLKWNDIDKKERLSCRLSIIILPTHEVWKSFYKQRIMSGGEETDNERVIGWLH